MKRGFTLVEMLVACLLMGMLVTILAQVFSQSSMAWRAGKAGLSVLDKARSDIAWYSAEADSALPKLRGSDRYVAVGAWDENGSLRERGYAAAEKLKAELFTEPGKGLITGISGDSSVGVSSYSVGVTSAGPDRKFGTKDDITTWPEDK